MKSLVTGSSGMARMIILALLLSLLVGCVNIGGSSGRDVLTDTLAEPLNGVKTAKFDIDPGDGNLTIDGLTGGEPLLAGGELQYLKSQGQPARTMVSFLDEATLTLEGGAARQRWLRLPWAACSGATEWRIHLNPAVSSDIIAHSGGGNVKLDLASLIVSHVSADTGGGNIDVVLPDNVVDLDTKAATGAGNVTVEFGSGITGNNTVHASSGAGNVIVYIPHGVAARIHATTGVGKVTVDPRFSKSADNTYQSSSFDSAANRIEMTLSSGAGNVIVNSK
jgi:hypothetical protein